MPTPLLYRKRFIPMETIHLKDDEIIKHTDEVIVTKWKTIKPRVDFSHGCSCVFLNKNLKISKFYNKGTFLYYYCDIIEAAFLKKENSYIISDLLVDVIVMPNGFVKVLDIGELTEALDGGIISYDMMKKALNSLDKLLDIIYRGEFFKLTKYVDEIE